MQSPVVTPQEPERPDARLRLPEVLRYTGYSRPTLYRRIADGQFPRGIKDGRITVWSNREVLAWQQARA